jgi:hypothetical protein
MDRSHQSRRRGIAGILAIDVERSHAPRGRPRRNRMTTFGSEEITCRVCGARSTRHVLNSTNTIGSRDLDLRPPPMIRDTMEAWVQCCAQCGLCAPRLDTAPSTAAAVVRTPEYQAVLQDPRFPRLANQFRALAFLEERGGDTQAAASSALHAAWVCDDAKHEELAVECRNRAITLFLQVAADKAMNKGSDSEPGSHGNASDLLLTDLFRRTSRFDEGRVRCQPVLQSTDKTMQAVARFQLALMEKGDTAAYSIAQAVDSAPPAG